MRVAVCGGRTEYLTDERMRALKKELLRCGATDVVTGGCRGIDLMAERFAQDLGLATTTFRPKWDIYGKAAGPLRNEEIANYAAKLIAFPGGAGTADMVRRMRSKGKNVVEIP